MPAPGPVQLGSSLCPLTTHRIGRYLHAVFGEFFGDVIYDGLWVGRDSPIPNIDGIRLDVIEGFREAGVTAVRWPGGCCADHYHWMDGVGSERPPRLHPKPQHPSEKLWRNEFGTDEFISFCRLVGAEPILIANVATGTPAEFRDWYEYCNGGAETKYGALRAANGHPEPYHVRIWGLGNTDENVWHIAFNDPQAYARDYLRWRTAISDLAHECKLIGLGLSERHEIPGWVEGFLDYVTSLGRLKGPDSLSVHHYIGGMKARYRECGPAVDYADTAYYYTLDALSAYQHDIDLHRGYIAEHTSPLYPTTISFDEWGLWHPEATSENGIHQPQTMRDAIFAACTFHLFYRNSDIVQYAMETQFSNLLQSLFETDGQRFYKTPTFHVFRLYKDHLEQLLLPLSGLEDEPMLDVLASATDDLRRCTITIVNKHLHRTLSVMLPDELSSYTLVRADIIAPDLVRAQNTFDRPDAIASEPLRIRLGDSIACPSHSVSRLVIEKR